MLSFLGLFLIISALAIHQGINEYDQQLESYKEQISQIKEVEGLVGWMPEKPSIMLVFMFMSEYIMMLGAILAIAMGFDLLSKEKETRTLKSLLSCPVFRDEIINGKALGGTLALVFAMGTALLISLAVLLIFSIVPSMNELAAILVLGIVSIVFLLAYFAIALTMSTVLRDSGSALLCTLVIFFILGSLLPIVGSTVATWSLESHPNHLRFVFNMKKRMSQKGPSDTAEGQERKYCNIRKNWGHGRRSENQLPRRLT